MGHRIGGGLGHVVGRIFGSGDYSVGPFTGRNNLIADGNLSFGGPFSNSVRVKHREYLGDVILPAGTAGSWALGAALNLNPGLPGTFPWLSSVADNFQEYRIHGLVAAFKSTSSDYPVGGTTSALPTIQLAYMYNVNAQLPSSKMGMLEMDWAVDCKASDSMIAPMECSPKQLLTKNYLVRNGSYSGDIALTDMGILIIGGVNNTTTAQNIGELSLIYDIELLKPNQPSTSGLAAYFHLSNPSVGSYTNGLTVNPTYGSWIATMTGNTIYFNPGIPSGLYQVQVAVTGGSGTPAVQGAINVYGSVTALSITNGCSNNCIFTSTSTAAYWNFGVLVTNTVEAKQTNYIVFGTNSGWPAAPSAMFVSIVGLGPVV